MAQDAGKPPHQPSKVWINGKPVENRQPEQHGQLHQPSTISSNFTSRTSSAGSADVKVVKAIGKMDLQRKMNKLMAKGYVPSGGPTLAYTDKTTMFMGNYTQVMIKY